MQRGAATEHSAALATAQFFNRGLNFFFILRKHPGGSDPNRMSTVHFRQLRKKSLHSPRLPVLKENNGILVDLSQLPIQSTLRT
jgi:hypothetical protein